MQTAPTFTSSPPTAGFRPVAVADVELTEQLPAIAPPESGPPWRAALIIGRVHGVPIGQVEVPLPEDGATSTYLRSALDAALGAAVFQHVTADAGIAVGNADAADTANTTSISSQEPPCAVQRRRALLDAPMLSVIVPTRDRPEQVRACVRSILACEYPADRLEVLVVDNVPRDGLTRAAVTTLAKSGPVRYLVEEKPGSASARNRALPEARGEFLVFTDDDAIVDRHWLAEIVRGFRTAPGVDAVSGLLVPRRLDTPARVWFEQYGGFSRGYTQRIFDLRDNRPTDEPLFPFTAGLFGTGNNMAFRAEILRAIGGFDPALGNGTPALGGVDSEVMLRTVVLGHRLVYRPNAMVWHDHRADYADLRRQVYSYGAGLTAYLLKTVTTNPIVLPAFVALVPKGIRFLLLPGSAMNSRKEDDYPRDLTRAELRGMLHGPLAYLNSRRMYGRHRVPRAATRDWILPKKADKKW
jgi:glycosyltransferase involved in cell wall biosynthesis